MGAAFPIDKYIASRSGDLKGGNFGKGKCSVSTPHSNCGVHSCQLFKRLFRDKPHPLINIHTYLNF